jgi:hypothetical protein
VEPERSARSVRGAVARRAVLGYELLGRLGFDGAFRPFHEPETWQTTCQSRNR